MLERDSYEGKTQKLLPLNTGPKFSWMNWRAVLFIFAATIALGKEVLLTNCALLVETAAQKTARIAKYAAANAAIVFAICQSAMCCDEGISIVTQHQMTDVEGSAFNLFTLLETRFTQKAVQKLQKLLVELNQLICRIGETPSQLLDRYNKIVLSITAIDAKQLPTEVQIIAILRNSISDHFKLLNAMLGVMADLTLVQLKEKFLNWEMKNEVGGNNETIIQAPPKSVANFANSGLKGPQKKAFVKKLNHGNEKVKSGAKFDMECWLCGNVGHLKRDCPYPDDSDNAGRKRNGGDQGSRGDFSKRARGSAGGKFGKAKVDGKLKSIIRKPKDQRSPSPSRHPQRSRNGAYIDADPDYDDANMIEEFVEDELLGERVSAAFQTGARYPNLICIDSGANIFILTWLIATYFNVQYTANRFIRTAAVGGRLSIEALYSIVWWCRGEPLADECHRFVWLRSFIRPKKRRSEGPHHRE